MRKERGAIRFCDPDVAEAEPVNRATGQLPPAGTDAAGAPCRSNRMMPACWRAALKPELGGKPAGDALRYPLERRG